MWPDTEERAFAVEKILLCNYMCISKISAYSTRVNELTEKKVDLRSNKSGFDEPFAKLEKNKKSATTINFREFERERK